MIDQALFEKRCGNDVEPVVRQARHGRFEFDASVLVQKVREDDPSVMRRKPVRDHAIEE